MRPEQRSATLLGITRSKAKMYEYAVPLEEHINIPQDPARLFTLAIGLLGDTAARSERTTDGGMDAESLTSLRFSARFFDAYLHTKLNDSLNPYTTLLASAAYYLCDFPGSSQVLAKMLGRAPLDLDAAGLEDLLRWALQGDVEAAFTITSGQYAQLGVEVTNTMRQFTLQGLEFEALRSKCTDLRSAVYKTGTPRELLLADIACSVIRKRCDNSTWRMLPLYSDLPVERWTDMLIRPTSVKELWPAQHLLGRAGTFRGTSAVVQMPTSAGKTRAIEIVIRSAFVSQRASLAVIVAPFRALCREIKNSLAIAFRHDAFRVDELSDAMQSDFEIAEILSTQQVLVLTPEKLVYVLRHNPELAAQIGVLIFDEGHQFDSGRRGVTYELLVTSLKLMVPANVQKILISAVLKNAEALATWLNGPGSGVVSGERLTPTFRTVGFASWTTTLGRIDFVTEEDVEKTEFFVPRVIEQLALQPMSPRERERVFPERENGQDVALLLGLKLCPSGAVAIFCGVKATAANLCQRVVDIFARGVALQPPAAYSDAEEIRRLTFLHSENLGPDSYASRSAPLGVYSHHGNTPHGIRLAVEHAMRLGLIKFVTCTSTLAQGVNLPIRYLLVTSLYQGVERIKVRDFHNLIGRAGRAGMHTEGSILFADAEIYDRRNSQRNSWRWRQVKELLEPSNSEPCISSLLTYFDRLQSDDDKYSLKVDPLELFDTIVDPVRLTLYIEETASQHGDKKFTAPSLEGQIKDKANIIAAIESFLMSHWDTAAEALNSTTIANLAQGTLAYHLADSQTQERLVQLFTTIGERVAQNVSDADQRRIYGRTLYGVGIAREIETWVRDRVALLRAARESDDMLRLLWPLIVAHCNNRTFQKCDPPPVLQLVASAWISGRPFHEILKLLQDEHARIIWGSKFRKFSIEAVVDICELGFGFDAALLVGAVAELLEYADPTASDSVASLYRLQKRLKYGLSAPSEIILYELGFADRAVARDINRSLGLVSDQRGEIIRQLRETDEELATVLSQYPSYFTYVWKEVLQ